MKGLKKIVLVSAIAAAPLAANAELKAVDDATLEAATGQSGLLVEVSLGSTTGADSLNKDYTNAGVTVDAFKWDVDLQVYDQATNAVSLGTDAGTTGGFVAENIALAGAIDVEIDGVIDGGTGHGGIAMVMNGNLDMKVGALNVYANAGGTNVAAAQSMGGIEFSGITLNNVSMVLSGR